MDTLVSFFTASNNNSQHFVKNLAKQPAENVQAGALGFQIRCHEARLVLRNNCFGVLVHLDNVKVRFGLYQILIILLQNRGEMRGQQNLRQVLFAEYPRPEEVEIQASETHLLDELLVIVVIHEERQPQILRRVAQNCGEVEN